MKSKEPSLKVRTLSEYERLMDLLADERKALQEIRSRRDGIANEHAQKIEKIEGLKGRVAAAWKTYKETSE